MFILGRLFDFEGFVCLVNGYFLVLDEYGLLIYEFDVVGNKLCVFMIFDNVFFKVGMIVNYNDGCGMIMIGC